ncbi:hypothetical protein [Croceiramulus getboli]|nr:hypothetical protein P8624_12165 [Flavobacteriaceae bacterium YJPT1-3]
MKNFLTNNKLAIYGGLISAIFVGLGVFLLGSISGYQAKDLLSSSLPGISQLCNTIILASATILALLLTLLGISTGTKNKWKEQHYTFVLNIAKIDTVLFVAALLFFQFFNLPVIESDNVPISWFYALYWISLMLSALLSGMMVTVILMLFNTVKNIIQVVGLGKDHMLVSKDNESSESSSD